MDVVALEKAHANLELFSRVMKASLVMATAFMLAQLSLAIAIA